MMKKNRFSYKLKGRAGMLKVMSLALCLCFFVPIFAVAQEQNPLPSGVDTNVSGIAELTGSDKDSALDPNLYVGLQDAFQSHMALRTPDVVPQDIKTVFFTLWQYKLLAEAKQWVRSRPPEERELTADSSENRPQGIRELSLGGILFFTGDHWTVWLNGQRVTPNAIPKEVMDIHVRKDYVELKWFDSFSNLIYPIRLRPHQRFNLDARIFLPGAPS